MMIPLGENVWSLFIAINHRPWDQWFSDISSSKCHYFSSNHLAVLFTAQGDLISVKTAEGSKTLLTGWKAL